MPTKYLPCLFLLQKNQTPEAINSAPSRATEIGEILRSVSY